MNAFCPNLNNKQIKREFEELINAVGEDAAYYLWNKNNGYSLDKAPNGAESKLFSDLLEEYNGDRIQAIKAKSKIYTDAFKKTFGDWQNTLLQFNKPKIIFGHPGIGKTYAIEGKYKDKFIDWDVEYNNKRDKWIEEHSNTKKGTDEYKKARNEYLIYPEKHPDYVKFLTKEWNRVKNKAKAENKTLFASPHTLLKLFRDDFDYIINVETSDFIERNINRGGKKHESSLWKDDINKTINSISGIPVYTIQKGKYLSDLLDFAHNNLDANGEPIKSSIQQYNIKKQYVRPELKNSSVSTKSDVMNQEDERSDYQILHDEIERIDKAREEYVRQVTGTTNYANQSERNKAQHRARKEFNQNEARNLVRDMQLRLASIYGLQKWNSSTDGGYYFSAKGSDIDVENIPWIEHFINSLNENTWKQFISHEEIKDRYKSIGFVQNIESLPTLLYNVLLDESIATIDKNLARDYVRMFWNTDAVQSALRVLDDKKNKKTVLQLETELVNTITNEEKIENIKDQKSKLKNFWSGLTNILSSIKDFLFDIHNKKQILKNIRLSFQLFDDLNRNNTNLRLYDRLDDNYESSSNLSEDDKKLFQDIKKGTKVRLESQLARNLKNNKLIADLKSRLEILDQKDEDSIDDVFDTIQDFLITANKEIGQTRYYIDNVILNTHIDNWDITKINDVRQDLIGYYQNILSEIYNLFTDPNSSVVKFANERSKDPHGLNLHDVSKQLLHDVDDMRRDYYISIIRPYTKYIMENFIDQEPSIAYSKKEKYKRVVNRWIQQNAKYGDLATGEVLIGMASKSKSLLIKILDSIIEDVETEKSKQVLRKSQELVYIYDKCRPLFSQSNPFNFQKLFMEKDRNGVPTGYFVREINEGQAYIDKDEFEQKLRIKYNLDVDEDGNTIFPEEDYVSDDSIYNQYNDELDEWLDQHFERRYKLEYYKARRRFLSPITQQKLNQIQRQIDLLKQKGMADGFFDRSKLTQNESRQLDVLLQQKRNLGEHYDFTTTTGGIILAREKDSDGLKTADEITAWNKYKQGKIKYKPNWDKFNKAVEKMRQDGKSEAEINQFISDNQRTRISEQFWEEFRERLGETNFGEEYEELARRYKEILNQVKPIGGYYSPNLTAFGTGLNTDNSVWKELARLDQQMANIKAQHVTTLTKDEALAKKNAFKLLATMLPVMSTENNIKPVVREIVDQWREAVNQNPALQEAFNKMFTYIDKDGKVRYLRAFEYLAPASRQINIGNKTIDAFENYLSDQFSDLDQTSELANPNFDINGKSMQAKKSLYKNKDFEKIKNDSKLKQLYDAMVALKTEADAMIPQRAINREMLLPQVTGRALSIIGSSLRNGEIWTAIKYPFKNVLTAEYAEKSDDIETNMDMTRRPDGSKVENIPVRFVDRLKDRSLQSTDIIGSLVMYYDMAVNYKMKSEILPTLEVVKETVNPRYATGTSGLKSQYDKISDMLSQRMYGHQITYVTDENKDDSKHKNTIRRVQKFRKLASLAMLAGNITSISVGYLTAMGNAFADAVGGRYFTAKDFIIGFIKAIPHTINAIRYLGKARTKDKLVAAMQYNQLSRSNAEIFGKTDQSKIARFISNHLLMGGYTLGDYLVNSTILSTVYHHYRLVENPITKEKTFMSREDVIRIFLDSGKNEKEAIKYYNKCKTTLWEAYEVNKFGILTVKDQYKDFVSKYVEKRITKLLHDRTAFYNGVLPASEQAKLQQNVFGSYITMMRRFVINTYWEQFNTQIDDVDEVDKRDINWMSGFTRDDISGVNLRTGTDQGALFKDAVRGLSKMTLNAKNLITRTPMSTLTRNQKYALKRVIANIVFITINMIAAINFAAWAMGADDDAPEGPGWTLNLVDPEGEDRDLIEIDKKNLKANLTYWFKWEAALVSARAFNESVTGYWPTTITETITTVSVAKSYLDKCTKIWDILGDIFKGRLEEEVKQGGYQHMSRATRDLCAILSPTGIDNYVKQGHVSGLKSTFNFYRQLTPTDMIIPSKDEWSKKNKPQDKKTKNKNKDDEYTLDEFSSDEFDFSDDFDSEF